MESGDEKFMKYEYIRLYFDFGDLHELNQLSSSGWRVVSVQPGAVDTDALGVSQIALLERPLPEEFK